MFSGAIHEVLAGVFERYLRGEPTPDNLGGFVHVAVRRKLIDRIREEAVKVSYRRGASRKGRRLRYAERPGRLGIYEAWQGVR
jgi:hypothetical protein